MSWNTKINKALKELRFVVSSPGNQNSEGARLFLKKHYAPTLAANPDFRFVIRECEGVDSFALFRYDFGIEKKIPIDNLSADEIETVVAEKVKGAELVNSSL